MDAMEESSSHSGSHGLGDSHDHGDSHAHGDSHGFGDSHGLGGSESPVVWDGWEPGGSPPESLSAESEPSSDRDSPVDGLRGSARADGSVRSAAFHPPSSAEPGGRSGAGGSQAGRGGERGRSFDAATVTQRWWEGRPSASADAGGAARAAMTPPPPPPPPAAGWSSMPSPAAAERPQGPSQAELDAARLRRLEQELAAARDEATALHEMLEDLPEIFERKFRQRLHGILEQQQLLLADNRMLRDQLFALQPAASELGTRSGRLLPPVDADGPAAVVAPSQAAGLSPVRGPGADPDQQDIRAGQSPVQGTAADADSPEDQGDGEGLAEPGSIGWSRGRRRRTLLHLVRGVLQLGRRLRSGPAERGRSDADAPDAVSDRDDGMPRAA